MSEVCFGFFTMPRQPLKYVARHAKFRIPANALSERPELAALIGECIAFCSQVEAYLAIMLGAIMKTETGISAAVFLSIRNSKAQREALTAAAQVGLQGRELEMFSAIAIISQSIDNQRADLAHGIFALSEDLPDDLLWMDSKDYTRLHIENWNEISKNATLVSLLSNSRSNDDAMRESFSVYRRADLESLRDEIKDLWRAVFLFTLSLRLPGNAIGEQEFQKLYTIPPIQRALSRIRAG
jgi:hypothetical protein